MVILRRASLISPTLLYCDLRSLSNSKTSNSRMYYSFGIRQIQIPFFWPTPISNLPPSPIKHASTTCSSGTVDRPDSEAFSTTQCCSSRSSVDFADKCKFRVASTSCSSASVLQFGKGRGELGWKCLIHDKNILPSLDGIAMRGE